jgi:methionyl-tRNA formyltransferase
VLRYIFMGTPPLAATILEKLCDDIHPPVAVVTQVAKAQGRGHKVQPSAVEAYARTQDLNVLSTLDVNAAHTFDVLKTFTPDLVLVAAFGQILKAEVLQLPKLFCLNVHASLLPKYRGAAPVQRAIWNGDSVTGVTIQKMARKLDTGDILLTKEISIEPEDTSETLLLRLANLGGEALVEALHLIEKDNYKFLPQDESKATYAKKIEKTDAPLDWKNPAEQLRNQIRALQPWPVAEAYFGQDRIRIFEALVTEGAKGKEAGEILTDGKSFLSVQCGDGKALTLTVIQPENRKRLDIKSFLNSFRGEFPHKKMGVS